MAELGSLGRSLVSLKIEKDSLVTVLSIFPRAENETRTRDPNLGKVVLYQLSYFRIISFATAGYPTRLRMQRYTKFFSLQIFRP